MIIDLDRMTYEESLHLNHRVVARLKMLDSMQACQEMMNFNLGARVSFETQHGRLIGKVIKFNRKTVTATDIDAEDATIHPNNKHLK